jgi:hypothetical protein
MLAAEEGLLGRESSADSSWFLPDLQVPLSPIVEHLTCAICMCVMQGAEVTRCGHSFCGGCIRAALNLKHECPLCKAPSTVEGLANNRQLNSLVESLSAAKADATDSYFRKLITSSAEAAPGASLSVSIPSTVEAAFRRHHEAALLGFQSVHQEITRAYALRRRAVAAEAAPTPAAALGGIVQIPCPEDLQGLAAEWRASLHNLQQAEEEALATLAADYQLALEQSAAPPPRVGCMAITVSCEVHTSRTQLARLAVRIQPTHFLCDLREQLARVAAGQ